MPLVTSGTTILMLGFIGFNGGSVGVMADREDAATVCLFSFLVSRNFFRLSLFLFVAAFVWWTDVAAWLYF